jgi:hypothetical protein
MHHKQEKKKKESLACGEWGKREDQTVNGLWQMWDAGDGG